MSEKGSKSVSQRNPGETETQRETGAGRAGERGGVAGRWSLEGVRRRLSLPGAQDSGFFPVGSLSGGPSCVIMRKHGVSGTGQEGGWDLTPAQPSPAPGGSGPAQAGGGCLPSQGG